MRERLLSLMWLYEKLSVRWYISESAQKSTPSVPICKHIFPLIKGCLHIGTEGVYFKVLDKNAASIHLYSYSWSSVDDPPGLTKLLVSPNKKLDRISCKYSSFVRIIQSVSSVYGNELFSFYQIPNNQYFYYVNTDRLNICSSSLLIKFCIISFSIFQCCQFGFLL